MDKQKTLICGDVNGNFKALFSRVETIVKKSGPFDVLLCAGNFFGDDNSQLDAYKMGTRKVPVTTYVFGPSKSEHVPLYCEEGSEIVPNVIYMGKRGIFTTSADVKIAYLTGLSRRELGKEIPMCTFEPSDCSAVRDACLRGQSEYRGVDLLITTLWPAGIQQDEITKNENLVKAEKEKQIKYLDLAHEVVDMWNVDSVIIVPIVVTANSLMAKSLDNHLPRLSLGGWIKCLIQKAVLLNTARIADIEEENLSNLLAWLAIHIKPRYHVVPSPDKHYERQPYRTLSTHQDYRELATRFIALAPVGNKAKEKWIYACSLQPISKMRVTDLLQGTTDETMCPYDPEMLKQHQPGKVVKFSGNGQYFFNMDGPEDDHGNRKRKGRDDNPERKKKEFDPDLCWFCLSSPSVEKHLVICVGTHCYLALAKGPLTPYHVLILPITHHQASTRLPDEILDEIKKFKEALRKFYSSMKESVVFFERNYKTSHMQIQSVPVPLACVPQLLEIFQDEAGIASIPMEILPPYADLRQITLPGAPYFHVELPTGEQIYAKTRQHFPLHFGRDVLSGGQILDCDDKADWRLCQLSREEELEHVKNFREKFRPFDFTADADSDSD